MSHVAYSYIRFSHAKQKQGDSLRRQTEASEAWCQRNDVRLDKETTLHDLGVSAFRKKKQEDDHFASIPELADLVNEDRRALAGFLELIKRRKVVRGSYLIIENLDRLSRDEVVPATHLLTGILLSGVRVVQLMPVEQVLTNKSTEFEIMMAVMELRRGHSESSAKAMRLGSAWAEKMRRVRTGETQKETKDMGKDCEFLTRRIPAWVEARGGKLYPIAKKSVTIQRIFQLSTDGYGAARIVRKLIDEKVPPLTKKWLASYVQKLLNDRRVVGELQMEHLDGSAAGEPVKGYYPTVITEDEWSAARKGVTGRRKAGKRGEGSYDKGNGFVNPFTGLLRDAKDVECAYTPTLYCHRGYEGTYRVLRNLSAKGTGPTVSFPYDTFEKAILRCLREVDVNEIIGGAEVADDRFAIAAELEKVVVQINKIKDNILAGGDDDELADVLRQLGAKKNDLVKKQREARERAAVPLEDAWKQTKDLIDAMEEAPDKTEYRLRLRAVLKREIERVYVLVVPRGRERACFVQVNFPGGKQRLYIVWHRPPQGTSKPKKDGRWWATSWVMDGNVLTSEEGQKLAEHFVYAYDPLPEEDASDENWISEVIPARR